jgi:SNF2 family DNA or RNA helicase
MINSYREYTWPMGNPEHRPFGHQIVTAEFLLTNKRAYVFSDIGTGKTLSALWAADILFELGRLRKVLIVSPLSTIQSVWGAEIFGNFPHRYYAIAHGPKYERVQAIKSEADFVIINFDGVNVCLSELIEERFDLIIIDELTAYKNVSADRTRNMQKLTNRCNAVWGMTGLPTPNSPMEAFGQAKVVNPQNPYLPKYFGQFRDMVVTQPVMGVFIPTPNADRVVQTVLQPSIRFTRDECLDLPPVLHQYIDIEMTAEQKRMYAEMKRELYAQYSKGEITASNAGVKLLKLLQIAAGAVIDDRGEVCFCDAENKIDAILDTFEELGRTKLIVVAAFRAVVERLCEIMQGKGIRCEFIHGGVDYKRRNSIISDFQSGDGQMLILQPEAVAHGITLTASSTIVWHSLVPSGETYVQMNGRITRAGQDKKQFVKHLISSAAEKRLVNILGGKTDLANAVLDLFAKQEL